MQTSYIGAGIAAAAALAATALAAPLPTTGGPAYKLVFTRQPAGAVNGAAFRVQPTITVETRGGTVVKMDSSRVRLSIKSATPATGSGSLSGCSQHEYKGVITFRGCRITGAGTSFRLHATSGSLQSVDSHAFNSTSICGSRWVAAFRSPGACGYPDPAYGNVGVPAGTTLTSRGGFSTSSMCSAAGPCTISGLDVSGNVPAGSPLVTVDTSNVTFSNDRFTGTSGGCGTAHTCGNMLIFQKQGVSNVTLSHVELTSNTGITVEHAVKMYGSGMLTMDHVYQRGDTDALCWCPDANISDSYSLVHLAIADDHLENIYSETSNLTVTHSVLLNAETNFTQGAVFAQTAAGQDAPCANRITLTDNLLAGGGYTLGLCAHATSVGTASLTVENNRFARCVTSRVRVGGGQWHCSGGPDQHGYLPFSGAYGPDADLYCSSGQTTWAGNRWDDNGSTVRC